MSDSIKKYRFKSSLSSQIEVIPLQVLIAANERQLIQSHRTSFYHIFILENCRPEHWVDFQPVKAAPYSLLFINKEQVHQFDKQLDYSGYVLIFTDNFFCQTENDYKFLQSSILFNDLQDNCLLSPERDIFDEFEQSLDAINKEIKINDKATSPIILKNLLHNFLLTAEREKRKQGFYSKIEDKDFDYIFLFRNLLEKHYTEEKKVSFYAEQLLISEKRLGKATLKLTGKLPKQMISERIMLEAKRLLIHSSTSIKAIAYMLGFDETTNFIKYFKLYSGKTPLEFRECHQKK